MLPPRHTLTASDRLDWLRLSRTENVGPVTFRRLIERFGTATAALAALPDLARRGGRTAPLRVPARTEVQREAAALDRLNARLLAFCEPEYPAALAAIEDAPPLIAVAGHAVLLARPAVAIVGARNASIAGKKMAERLGRELAAEGYLVVSGMARGIDTAAHAGALDGGTCAVVAGGLDVVYPPENRDLHAALMLRGAIVAESPLGTEPQARHFPRRNRIISGLCLGVLVVEAALKSGSLITARMALDQGREVLAVPGSPADPRAQGCNRLIKQGAILVESVEDVVDALRRVATGQTLAERQPNLFQPRTGAVPDERELEGARGRVIESLSPTPVLIDEVIRGCQLSAGVVRTVLLELELAGRVQQHPGGQVSLI